jgi:hypothetical protein
MLTKQCSKCGVHLALSEFRQDKSTKIGHRADCRECERLYDVERRRSKGAKPKATKPTERTKEYRREERKRAAERQGRIYRSREDLSRIAAKVNPEVKALHRIAKKVKAGIKKKPWQSKYLPEATRYRLRYKADPYFNLKEKLRRQITKQMKKDKYADLIRSAINRGGESPTVARLFGYSIKELKASLASKFSEGMTWNAFLLGEIHIDHIKPVAAHDLSIHEEFISCWSMENLQPLWAKDNLVKSCKWDGNQ